MSSLVDDEISDEVGREQANGGLRHRRGQAWLVVGALVVALAGWVLLVRPQQRPSLEATTTETPDPCSLVAVAAAGDILGPVGEPEERPGMGIIPGQRSCALPRPEGPLFAAVVAIGHLDQSGGEVNEDDPRFGGRVERLDGLGDHASWIPPFRLLVITAGNWAITIQMLEFGRPIEELREQATQLGTIAVARL